MKKTLFILFISLISNVSFAQLAVENTTYIYVDDVVLFVENDVKLDTANDFIYLRNEAQLIQGAGVTGNSGIGKLSVYQNGTVNNYNYNYWGSPVGNTDTDDNANRTFRANNVLYDVISVPITSSLATYTGDYNGTSNPLVIADYWLFTFNPGTGYAQWDEVGNTGTTGVGYGFTMKGTSGSGNNQLYDFRGKPNTGDIDVNVVLNNFTLVGNPYPSAIYANDFIWDPANVTNLNNTLYFWEQDTSNATHYISGYIGGYATYTITFDGNVPTFLKAPFNTYNSDGSLNVPNGGGPNSSSKQVKEYIPIGQGFMIMGDATGIVTFKNSMRYFEKESGSNSEFFRIASSTSAKEDESKSREVNTNSELALNEHGHPIIEYDENGFNILPNDYQRFRLNIDFNDIYTRQLVQTFNNSATDGFDRGLESQRASDLESDAYWVIEDIPYVAQAFKFNKTLEIPLIVVLTNAQTIRFRAVDIQNFESVPAIYLYDTFTNNSYDLKLQDVELYLEVGNYDTRFKITFQENSVLNIDDDYTSQLQLFQDNGQSVVTILNPNSLDLKDFKLYDINGRLIFSKNKLEMKNKYIFNTSNLSSGVYLANIKLSDSDILISKKLMIFNN